MKKGAKKALKFLTGLLILIVITGVGGWFYLNSKFINFEDDFTENLNLKEITIDGFVFLDRNGNEKLDIYEDNRNASDERVADLLEKMTIEEKIHLLKGSGLGSALGMTEPEKGIPGAAGVIAPTPRLGIPTIYLSDGPAGLRIEPTRKNDDKKYFATAFPIATLLASTWNTDLVESVGHAMGEEALQYGVDVILGPGANIQRHPFNGRNFEYYSEDPLLTGFIGAAMVNGIESNGVGASVKHFVANNQETNRNNNDVIVSERAMREIYLKGFEIIIKQSQPWTIMSSYNKVNGTYTSESKELLTDILRGEWGFQGVVMTDWFGGVDAPAQIKAGNDLLEPGTRLQWNALLEAHENGELSNAEIDISVRRILKLIVESRKMEDHKYSNEPNLESHARITQESASEGMVLLKNENALPLKNGVNVALIGVTSYDFIAGGTGSGDVNEAYSISLEQGLMNNGFEINEIARGIYESHKEANLKKFVKPEGMKAMFVPYDPPEIVYSTDQIRNLASVADAAILTIGRNSGEGGDRVEADDFILTETENEMLKKTTQEFHQKGKKVIVVLNIGGVIETSSWKDQSDAILLAWQGGQEGGNSVANILSGKVNPSAKLPMTFPIQVKDHAAHRNFPLGGSSLGMFDFFNSGKTKPEKDRVRNEDFTIYEEGIYVGYRHFDKKSMDVSYPFGFGLSYTDFEYANMDLTLENDTINISLSVQNIGKQLGKEVVQIYISKPGTVIDRPYKELKGFTKTKNLAPNQTEDILIRIPVSELRYWVESNAFWALENGTYKFQAGSSSRDIRLTDEIEL
ncbi:MAG: glycoside hydrolase family 3 N-terminal domain-containing protein, partial [Eudoraea sp.]|uniref:glycoside hydrolase family 3 C-terminal domain-containing protein n=1 Tax=Eudoraea sp. TaxID=1979955 RepID=UPI003C78D1E4